MGASRVRGSRPQRQSDSSLGDRAAPPATAVEPDDTLREHGEQLLQRSRDVHYEVEAHPAYERILSELAPDEARILRLLLLRRPAALGRRPHRRPGRAGQLAADRARAVDDRRARRVPLRRPGPVLPQQPVPARPDLVLARDARATRWTTRCSRPSPTCSRRSTRFAHAKVVRRSVHLTPFGDDFCRVCLNPDGSGEQRIATARRAPADRPRTAAAHRVGGRLTARGARAAGSMPLRRRRRALRPRHRVRRRANAQQAHGQGDGGD